MSAVPKTKAGERQEERRARNGLHKAVRAYRKRLERMGGTVTYVKLEWHGGVSYLSTGTSFSQPLPKSYTQHKHAS